LGSKKAMVSIGKIKYQHFIIKYTLSVHLQKINVRVNATQMAQIKASGI